MFPIEKVRQQFPAISRKYKGKTAVYLDGPGGTQVTKGVIDSMVSYMTNGVANRHGEFPTSLETEKYIENARIAVADLYNVSPKEVAFGPNATSLMFSISRALGTTWISQDNIVVSEMDHCSNIDSWVSAAKEAGAEVRYIPVNNETLTLDLSQVTHLIDERTKLVSVTLASNAIGTITDIETIAKQTHEVGAFLAVDAVHATPHISINRNEIGADIILSSAYKFFGPHLGIAVIKEKVFEQLPVYQLGPAPSYYPDKLETGTQNHEGIAAVEAAINFIASLGAGSDRKEKIQDGLLEIEAHENALAHKIRHAFAHMPEITMYQSPESITKAPTIAFTIDGANPVHVCKWLAENHSIFTASGDFYASILADKIGVMNTGGWIRIGIAPYNTEQEADRFIHAVQSYVKEFEVAVKK